MTSSKIRSMTGFGRAEIESPLGRFTAEIKSVNSRFAEIKVYLPPAFGSLEPKLRDLLKKKIRRGKLDCRVRFQPAPGQIPEVRFNETVMADYLAQLRSFQEKHGLKGEPLALDTLLRLPGATEEAAEETDLDQYWGSIEEVARAALAQFQAEREREGAALAEHIREELQILRERRELVDRGKEQVVEKFRERLRARIEELESEIKGKLEPGRLEIETALYADRADIREELVRLEAHLDRLESIVDNEKDEPTGKALEFLLQEILREVNTTASKLRDLELVEHALAMKGAVERIREQIQNLE